MPPCFLVVCNNTSTSKLVHDFIAGFSRENEDRSTTLVNGRLELFRNFDEHGNPLSRLRTLLIDSEQLDSGEALDKNFRVAAGDEIERFRRERIQRTGDRKEASIFTAEPVPVKPQKPRETVLVVLVDDGCGDDDDLLRLVVEVKATGARTPRTRSRRDTYWVPGVNNLGAYGRRAFAELSDVYQMEEDFEGALEAEFRGLLDRAVS